MTLEGARRRCQPEGAAPTSHICIDEHARPGQGVIHPSTDVASAISRTLRPIA
jgi:hypothetical protein